MVGYSALLCWTCRISEILTLRYGQGQCLALCPIASYRATIYPEYIERSTLSSQVDTFHDPNGQSILLPSVTAPPTFSPITDATAVGWVEAPSTILVGTTSSSTYASVTYSPVTKYVRVELEDATLASTTRCWLIWKSFMQNATDSYELFTTIGFQDLFSGTSVDRWNISVVIVCTVLCLYFSAAVTLFVHARRRQLRADIAFGLASAQAEGVYEIETIEHPVEDDEDKCAQTREQLVQLLVQHGMVQEGSELASRVVQDGLEAVRTEPTHELTNATSLSGINDDTIAPVQSRIAELESQLEREKTEAKKAKDDARKKESDILALKARVREEQDKIQDEKRKSKESEKALRKQHEVELTNLRNAHQSQVSEVREKYQTGLRKVQDDQKERMSQATPDAEMCRLPAAYESEIERLKTAHARELERVKELGDKHKAAYDDLRERLADVAASHHSELNSALEASEQAKRDLKVSHHLELKSVREEAAKRIDTLNESQSQLEQELRTAQEDALRIEEDGKVAIETAQQEAQDRSETTAKAHQSEVQTQLSEKAELQGQLDEQRQIVLGQETKLGEAKKEASRFQSMLDELKQSHLKEARQRDETEERLRQNAINLEAQVSTRDEALKQKESELIQAGSAKAQLEGEVDGLRLESTNLQTLKSNAEKQRDDAIAKALELEARCHSLSGAHYDGLERMKAEAAALQSEDNKSKGSSKTQEVAPDYQPGVAERLQDENDHLVHSIDTNKVLIETSNKADPGVQAVPSATTPPDPTQKAPSDSGSQTKKRPGLGESKFAPSTSTIPTVNGVDREPAEISSDTEPSVQAVPSATAPPNLTRNMPVAPRLSTMKKPGLEGSKFAPSTPSIPAVGVVNQEPGPVKLPSAPSYSTPVVTPGLDGSNVRMAASHTQTTPPQNPAERGPSTSAATNSTGPRGASLTVPHASVQPTGLGASKWAEDSNPVPDNTAAPPEQGPRTSAVTNSTGTGSALPIAPRASFEPKNDLHSRKWATPAGNGPKNPARPPNGSSGCSKRRGGNSRGRGSRRPT